MNTNEKTTKNQVESENCIKKSRADYRREKKAAVKAKESKSKCEKVQGSTLALCDQELLRKIDEITENLKAKTWCHLETSGKFKKNEKISFISDDMLIVGCDIGSETHYMRAIDTRGRELSRKALAFDNNAEGFGKAKDWAVELAAKHGKTQIVLGLEPTGHYWFTIASWMVTQGISVVQVNPYAVKQTKEVEDNSQRKDDRKDPKLIANLVKDGNYGMPYIPEGIYADLRGLALFRDQLTEDRIRCMNRLHRELKIYFPEYKEAYGKVDGAFSLALLKEAPFPKDILKLGTAWIREIWHNAKLRGRGYAKAEELVRYAEESIGLKEGAEENREPVKWYAEEITRLTKKLSEIEEKIHQKCMEIPHAENVLEIPGIGGNIMGGILSELGDISRFDDAKEIQKLSGLGLVACSSGKHTGETRISRRGRKRLRYWLFQGAKSAVAHSPEFKALHNYYTTREENPLKKMQSLVVIACKLLRVIYTILKTGVKYDPEKMTNDIVYEPKQAAVA